MSGPDRHGQRQASGYAIVSIRGHHSVDATVEKLKSILDCQRVKIFAVIDHSGEAEKAGMPMRNTNTFFFF